MATKLLAELVHENQVEFVGTTSDRRALRKDLRRMDFVIRLVPKPKKTVNKPSLTARYNEQENLELSPIDCKVTSVEPNYCASYREQHQSSPPTIPFREMRIDPENLVQLSEECISMDSRYGSSFVVYHQNQPDRGLPKLVVRW
jgi:hypothetical protein